MDLFSEKQVLQTKSGLEIIKKNYISVIDEQYPIFLCLRVNILS